MSKQLQQEIQGGRHMVNSSWVAVHDNFFPVDIFDSVIEASQKHEQFETIRNDVDGVSYPLINRCVPDAAIEFLETFVGSKVNAVFMRQSPEGVHVPHIHHTDNSMGRCSFMLYLDDYEGQHAGTSFVRHVLTGVARVPAIPALVDMLQPDQNKMEAWAVHAFCEARKNRACIFDAAWFHRAEPVGGFGEGGGTRCVLTAFYD